MAKIYAGLFDDRLYHFPGNFAHLLDRESFKDNLINGLLLGDTLFINDGYLLQNPRIIECLERGPNTLFFWMYKCGYINILSRDVERPLWELPEYDKTIAPLQKTSEKLKLDLTKERIRAVNQTLDQMGEINDCRLAWPKHNADNVRRGFVHLIEKFYSHIPVADPTRINDENALNSAESLKETYEGFIKAVDDGNSLDRGARTVWEEVVKEVADGVNKQDYLMTFANVCYHINFTAALKGSDLGGTGEEIRVQTINDPWNCADVTLGVSPDNNERQEIDFAFDIICWDCLPNLLYPSVLRKDNLQRDEVGFIRDFLENTELKEKRQGIAGKLESVVYGIAEKNDSPKGNRKEKLTELVEQIDSYNEDYKRFTNRCDEADLPQAIAASNWSATVSPSRTPQSFSSASSVCSIAKGGNSNLNLLEECKARKEYRLEPQLYIQTPKGQHFIEHEEYYKGLRKS